MNRKVVFEPRAQADLDDIYDWIADRAGERAADRFMVRIRRPCERLDLFPERGTQRDDHAPGLRVFGIERRVTIAFKVYDDRVAIIRVLYGGRNIDAILENDGEQD
jgi:toxin ParE1/3/4